MGSFYNGVVKSEKGKMRMSISEDWKGIDIGFRIGSSELSNNLKVILGVMIDRYKRKDGYVRWKDEEG